MTPRSDPQLHPGIVVTYLQMLSPDALQPASLADPAFAAEWLSPPDWTFNRSMYEFVGSPWSWLDKAGWSDVQWRAYAGDPELFTFRAVHSRSTAGYFELKRHSDLSVEIAYFGLLPDFIGRRLGGSLLTFAIREAWKRTRSRVWVHTCNLDHPAALPNYLARGFHIYRVEPPDFESPSIRAATPT